MQSFVDTDNLKTLFAELCSLSKDTPFEVDLQWFAPEDEGRTEEPTEHKLRKAREEGKVAKSVEVSSALVLLFGILALGVLASYILTNALTMIEYFFRNCGDIDITKDFYIPTAFLHFFLKLVVPTASVVFIAALIGNIVQVGFLITAKPIMPDFNRIVPRFGKFFKRAFFSREAAFNIGKAVLKIVFVVLIAFLNIRSELGRIIKLTDSPFFLGLQVISGLAFRIIVEAAIVLLVLSVFDYFFQRRQHRESLKMSRQEIKEERRMYEGDPLVRSRLRERMRELLMRNMLQAVPRADVVITNPTHYAAALEWNRTTMIAPTLTAKGADNIAQKIKDVAQENSVPIVENKPLAQALYKEVEIGDVIPEKFYAVLATILAEVYKLSGKLGKAV